MATQVQRRRGTTAQNAGFTGAEGEVTFDTQLKRLLTHDGAILGGFPVAMLHLAQTFAQTQTITPPVNNTALFISGVSSTGADATSFLRLNGTWNTTGSPAAIHVEIANTASGADAKAAWIKISNLFAVTKPGLQLENPTAAFSGLQQYSPSLRWVAQGFKTAATAGSQPVAFRQYVQPVQGVANPTANLLIDVSINNGAFTNLATFSSFGLALTTQGAITANSGNITAVSGSVIAGPTAFLAWSGRTLMSSPADGQLLLFNNAGTNFTRVMFGGTTSAFPAIRRTGATLDFRLADDSAYAGFTSGNHTFATAALLSITSGTNQRAGNATLVAGTVTVSNTTVTANTIVLLTRKTSGGTLGTAITYTVSAGTSFTINSDSALDTSTFSYFLIEVP